MKYSGIIWVLMMTLSESACAQIKIPPKQELTIPNMDSDSPPCIVKVPVGAQCTVNGCTLPAAAGRKVGSIDLEFRCAPISAPNGFENPASDVELDTFPVGNTLVHLSLVEGDYDPPQEPFRNLSFCMYGATNNFCGYAKVKRSRHRLKDDDVLTVKRFIRGIEFQGAMPAWIK
jgi:hypothetical protein